MKKINEIIDKICKKVNSFKRKTNNFKNEELYPLPSLFEKVHKFNRPNEAIKIGIYPYFREIAYLFENGTEVFLADGKKCFMFGSNDYLGLSKDPRVIEASILATRIYGTGFGGSRFLNGNTKMHRALEERLANFLEKEETCLFSTGYQTNQGIVPLINSDETHVFIDESDHASIISALVLSRAKKIRFKHNDIQNLEKKIASVPTEKEKLIIVDGVYSMEGDIANLPKICAIGKKYGAGIMVDDAHGIGVIGKKINEERYTYDGRGTSAYFGVTQNIDIIMGTFSKSFGAIGGFLASNTETIKYIKHTAASEIFSASLSAGLVAAVSKALEIIQNEPERIALLSANTAKMRKELTKMGYNIGGREEIPIIPIYIGGLSKEKREVNALLFTKKLEEEGLFVNPIISPAVKSGKELIRISMMATHSEKQINYAIEKLEKVGKELNLIK